MKKTIAVIGSVGGILPGLSGDECEANADAAIAAATSGDIRGALDILRGIDAEVPGDDVETDDETGSGVLDAFDGLSSASADDEADATAPAA